MDYRRIRKIKHRKASRICGGKAERWASASGATFEEDKTAFIHFTRAYRTRECPALKVMGEDISPQTEVKVFGVIFDQDLRFKHHAARATKRGTKAALTLKRLKGMTVKTARQLFLGTVAPTIGSRVPGVGYQCNHTHGKDAQSNLKNCSTGDHRFLPYSITS